MKKKLLICIPRLGKRTLMMKLCVLFILGFQLQLPARGFAQHERMDISVSGVSIENLIEQIKQRTGIGFLYNIQEVEKSGSVSVHMKNATVSEILDEAFKGKKLAYNVVNDVFVIKPVANQNTGPYVLKGKVLDENGLPLPGVAIVIEGTKIGTATDAKGLFTITSPTNTGTLMCSSIGYQSTNVKFVYEKGKDLSIKLKESVSKLDEVTVVAYGETTKREMTGSVSVVSSDELKGLPTPSISNLLQGRVPGMDVTNVTGAPGGGGTQVTIRGYNSLSVESGRRFSNPLWVVDGVPMNTFTSPVTGTNGLSDLNPETIESVQVLKDATATSLYGSRAANGVIIVTTKKGKKDQPAQFDVNFSQTYSILPEYPTITGGKAERDYRLQSLRNYRMPESWKYPTSYEDAYKNGGSVDYFAMKNFTVPEGYSLQDSLNPFYNNSTNFFKYYFQPGRVTNANIQTIGGNERMTYSVGLGYYDEKGILKNTGFNRANLMGNFNFTPIKRVSIDFRTSLSFSDRSRGQSEVGTGNDNIEIEVIPGNPIGLSSLLPGNNDVVGDALKNLQQITEKNTSYRLRNSFGLGVDIIEGLKLTANLSLDYVQNNRNNFAPSTTNKYKESVSMGEIGRDMTLLNEDLLTYKRTFDGNHNLDVMLGFSYQYDEGNYIGGSGQNGPSDLVQYVTEGGWPSHIVRENGEIQVYKNYSSNFIQKKMASYFGRVNYNYKQKYMVSVTLRRDGSSVFGRDLRWATFPSVGLAWNFSDESFMDWLPAMDFGKIRASWGVSGNQFHNAYLAYGVLEGWKPYNGQPALKPNFDEGFYNPNLGWEETAQYDFGIDMEFFNYRLSVTADYYNRTTKDLLYLSKFGGNHLGYLNQWVNAANLGNQGVEIEISYDIFRNKDLKWNLSVNMARNWNVFKGSHSGRDLVATSGEQNDFIIGKSIGSIMGLKTTGMIQSDNDMQYHFNSNGKLRPLAPQYVEGMYQPYYIPGDLNFVDVNGDGEISYKDYQHLGSSIPKLYGGIVNIFQWKNFDVNMLWSFSLGRDMINALKVESLTSGSSISGPIFADLSKTTFWQKEGDQSDYPFMAADSYNMNWSASVDRNVERVNYLKLKTLTVGYSLPTQWKKKSFIKDVRIFFSGENLLTITNYSGMDPETVDINTGFDQGIAYPLARKLTLGITIKL